MREAYPVLDTHFGQGYDSKYGQAIIDQTPQNGVGVMVINHKKIGIFFIEFS
jgi:hypothetical protein